METSQEIINALRESAGEIRRLRREVRDVKAEAWDVHSEVIKQIFSRGQGVGICRAHQAEHLANEIERHESSDTMPL